MEALRKAADRECRCVTNSFRVAVHGGSGGGRGLRPGNGKCAGEISIGAAKQLDVSQFGKLHKRMGPNVNSQRGGAPTRRAVHRREGRPPAAAVRNADAGISMSGSSNGSRSIDAAWSRSWTSTTEGAAECSSDTRRAARSSVGLTARV